MKNPVVIAAVAFLAVIGVIAYFIQKQSLEPLTPSALSSGTEAVPTPQYFFAHPDLMKQAEQKCHDGDMSSSLYCSNVHRAESLRLADQYRRALNAKGTAQ